MTASSRFWAVDKLILGYFAFSTALVFAAWDRLSHAPVLLGVHAAAAALIVLAARYANPASRVFRYWYPLPYVAYCYKEMADLVPALRGADADRWLANLDFRVWGVYPTVWLERITTPAFTEFLQIAYTLFVPAVLLVAFILWKNGAYSEFRYYAFLIALGFLASYVGYLIVPARGPRFLLRNLQHVPLQGMWLFHGMQNTLDRLESVAYDCFPSGHTELTLLAWWYSRTVSRRLFSLYSIYTPCLIFATVYLRYHYTVDLFAGGALAFILILGTPVLYRRLS